MENMHLFYIIIASLCIQHISGYYYSQLQCHKCKKAPNHEACNNGVEVCKKDYTACITKVDKKSSGKIEITKGCSKAKYCKDPQPNCDKKGNKCSFCCYHDMCNVRNYPNPDNIDPCGCKPCLNGGTCQRNWFKFTCDCKPGFTGRYCENKVSKPDPCKSKPCKNGGSCWSCNGNWFCNCPPAYTGTKCEKRIDPCKPDNPCLNGGRCSSNGDTYKCRCRPGFDGEHCEHERNPCSSKPCQNGGTCLNHFCSYTCLCRPGFSGRNCEESLHNCFLCPKEGGLYKDPLDCHKFYQCCNWVPYHKDCPEGLHFNIVTSQCDWPWNADCTASGGDPDEDGSSCGVEQSRKRRKLTEDEKRFIWEEDAEDEHGKKREHVEEKLEEELQEINQGNAREFVKKNEEKIDSILTALVEIEEEFKKRTAKMA